jgi:hypothetical protein
MSDSAPLTISAFARLRKVSRVTVYTWCARGYVVRDNNGLVQVAASVAKLDARPQVNRGGVRGGTPAGWSSWLRVEPPARR